MARKYIRKIIKRVKNVGKLKKRIVNVFKFNRDRLTHFIDNYILDELLSDEIHNDLGASFTKITRLKGKIRKSALPEGEEKLSDEIKWYLRFQKTPLRRNIPKIFNYSLKKGEVYMDMKYYTYPSMRKIILNDMNAQWFLNLRWKKLISLISKNFYSEFNSREAPIDFIIKTHFVKALSRFSATVKMSSTFDKIIKAKNIKINDKDYINAKKIIEYISGNEDIMRKLTPKKVYLSHGDLHPNNILCGIRSNDLILLDCRGRSPYGDEYYDMAYDISKLYHDIHSYYSLIERHEYSLYADFTSIPKFNYTWNHPELNEKLDRQFKFVYAQLANLRKKDKNLEFRALFTEAMLYLTMIPFHLKVESEGIMCYLTGVIRLNEWFKKYYPGLYEKLKKSK